MQIQNEQLDQLIENIKLILDKDYINNLINRIEPIKVLKESDEMKMDLYDIGTIHNFRFVAFTINTQNTKEKNELKYTSYIIYNTQNDVFNNVNLPAKDLMQRIYRASLNGNHYLNIEKQNDNYISEESIILDKAFEKARSEKFGQRKIFNIFWGRDNKYLIGYIYKDNSKFIFEYNKEGLERSSKEGFNYLIGFKDINKRYENDRLFSVFSSRIPSPHRHNINEILSNYGMTQYDEIELLKKTKGILSTDNLEIREVVDNE